MPTPGLRELQGLFWRSISNRPEPSLVALSEPSTTLAAGARLRVYADAYFWRLHDVLAGDFPRLAAILGPERFEAVVREYLGRHPSTHPSLRHLGRHLPATIAGRADLPPYLADLARLEWARRDVFDAPDCEPLTPEALRAVGATDWPHLRFIPIPALTIVRAGWPVHELWEDGDAAYAPAATFIRVWRGDDDRVYHAATDARDAGALDRLLAGEPFEAICSTFDDLAPLEGAERATALLAGWLEDGILARVVR